MKYGNFTLPTGISLSVATHRRVCGDLLNVLNHKIAIGNDPLILLNNLGSLNIVDITYFFFFSSHTQFANLSMVYLTNTLIILTLTMYFSCNRTCQHCGYRCIFTIIEVRSLPNGICSYKSCWSLYIRYISFIKALDVLDQAAYISTNQYGIIEGWCMITSGQLSTLGWTILCYTQIDNVLFALLLCYKTEIWLNAQRGK